MNETGRLIPYLTEMFRFQAWLAMGKIANPMTGQIDRDLGVARHCIDLLAELETRTEGHRSGDETKLLQGALTELRLNYLEEMKRPAESASPEGSSGAEKAETAASEETTETETGGEASPRQANGETAKEPA